ncbi:hypothetical protein EB796_004803 [Bugula neritina]|uniref:Uncharacterized protein n=1 Tax=Bugula neritina TaxID=10212 RepID=A0A7J7KE23_BUGNE|nr:hypothetical protein EB796_004803 [Bugula neritina]
MGPDARSGHRIVIDDSNIYSYGGYNPSPSSTITDPRDMAEFPLFRELWKFNLTSNTWNRLDMTGSVPKECVSYACILVNKSCLSLEEQASHLLKLEAMYSTASI